MQPPLMTQPVALFLGGTDEQLRTGDPLSPAQKVELSLSHYFWIRGRASRSEFWWFTLACLVATLGLTILENVLGLPGAVSWVVGLATWIPSITVSVRRLHDIDRTGWWLLAAISLIGIVLLLYWNVKEGDPAPNRFNVQG